MLSTTSTFVIYTTEVANVLLLLLGRVMPQRTFGRGRAAHPRSMPPARAW